MSDLKMPEPSGYKILIAIPKLNETFENTNIVRPDVVAKVEETASVVGLVVKLGPDAYKDTERYPNGPWCKEGDFIITRPMAGSRIKIHGRAFRMINDDAVEGVVEDPRGITRA